MISEEKDLKTFPMSISLRMLTGTMAFMCLVFFGIIYLFLEIIYFQYGAIVTYCMEAFLFLPVLGMGWCFYHLSKWTITGKGQR